MNKFKNAAKLVVATRKMQKNTILSSLTDPNEASPIKARSGGENYSGFRRCFQGESSYYHASLMLAILAGLEGGGFTILFELKNREVDVEKTPFMLISTLAAFLVVFRTQICYTRYWEGRGAVGRINKSCRTLLLLFISNSHNKVHNVRLLLAVFVLMVMRLFRIDSLELMGDMLNDNEIKILEKTKGHKPLIVLSWITKDAVKDPDGLVARSMWAEVSQLVGAINEADKIATTPIPASYHFATRCVLWVFCFSVPICIASYHHAYYNIAVSMFTSGIITFLFFLISFVSEDLEDPFSGFLALPLHTILNSFFADVNDLVPELHDAFGTADSYTEALTETNPLASGCRTGSSSASAPATHI